MADNIVAKTGSFTGTGQSDTVCLKGQFNVTIWGTFVGTVHMERSFDGGTTWVDYTSPNNNAFTWTGAISTVGEEPEVGVLYRLDCTAFTSGTINYRISQ